MTKKARDCLGFLRGANDNSTFFCHPIYMDATVRIGVHPACDVNINAEFISPIQCEITCRKENGFFVALITDKSDNGTYLNGELIGLDQTAVLYPGCIISFVSKHINLMYIQAHKKDLNYTYEENFSVPLYAEGNQEKEGKVKNNKKISVTHKTIGSGSQAEVVLANVSFNLRHQLTCKKYRNKYNDTYSTNQRISKNTEISILKSNKHSNVMSMISEFQRDGCTHTFSPLYVGGTLKHRIKRKSPIRESDAFFIFHQIASGLQYLHDKEIIHCDLKPDNILLADLSEKPRAIINDFGLSIYSKPENNWPSNYGTLAYHSPEIVKEELFTEKVDCWALGVILYEIFSKQHPFARSSDKPDEIKERILKKEPVLLVDNISSDAKELIANLLNKEPKKRFATVDCFSSKWVYKNCDQPFYTAYLKSKEHYKKERAFWFEGIIATDEEQTGMAQHPDHDEKTVERLKKKRGIHGEGRLFKNHIKINKYAYKHEGDFLCLAEERFPRRTLQKKTLEQCLAASSNTSNDSGGSSKSSVLLKINLPAV